MLPADPPICRGMARLDLYRGGTRVSSLHLHSERNWLVGRDSSADMRLEDELASRRHFQLGTDEQGWRLEDLDTPNGTLVNGVREFGRSLTTACTLQVGREIMIFDPLAVSDAEPDDTLPAWALAILGEDEGGDMPSTCHMPPAHLRHLQAQERIRTRPHLADVTKGSDRLWALDSKINPLGLGPVQISLGDTPKNRPKLLAQVHKGPGDSFTVKAVGLFGKVKINGVGAHKAPLAAGDVLEVGGVRLRFFPGLDGRADS